MIFCKALLALAFISLAQVWGTVSASAEPVVSSLEHPQRWDNVPRTLSRRGQEVTNGKWTAAFDDIGEGLCKDGSYTIRFDGNTLRVRFHRDQDFVVVDNDFFVAKCGFTSSTLVREGEPTPKMFHDPGPLHDATPKRRDLTEPEHAVTIDLIPDPFSEKELQDIADLNSGNATTGGYIVRRQNGAVEEVMVDKFQLGIKMWYGNAGETWRVTEFNIDFPA